MSAHGRLQQYGIVMPNGTAEDHAVIDLPLGAAEEQGTPEGRGHSLGLAVPFL